MRGTASRATILGGSFFCEVDSRVLPGRRIRERLDWRLGGSPGCIDSREGRDGRGGSLRGILKDGGEGVQFTRNFGDPEVTFLSRYYVPALNLWG